MTVATKLGRVVSYHKMLPSIKSRELLMAWSLKSCDYSH